MLENTLKDAASATPDPERAFKNLLSFCDANPRRADELTSHLRPASMLFSISQFLANFSISNPDALFEAIGRIKEPFDRESLHISLREELADSGGQPREALMGIVRRFKKRALLRNTLRDILNVTDISESMFELSMLADVIVGESLQILKSGMREIYGEPDNDAFSVIAVGKLGANELNFSSDIDLMYLYATEHGETSGVAVPQGIGKNRISNHEYFCKLGEGLSRFLSMSTGDGIAYRVDLRLRPEGHKGSIAMSLSAYEIYYESWGRAWERAVFLKARPAAGDRGLGTEFMEMMSPFVYRKYLDFNAIDEIRRMKTKIDETFKKDDIKRGYGGIREIEFFVNALQLIYGGRDKILRNPGTLKCLHLLLQKNIIGQTDCSVLLDNYAFLRKLEHRIQQVNDLQTHSIPPDRGEVLALARKMGFPESSLFLSDLRRRRSLVRQTYDSLFRQDEPGDKKSQDNVKVFFDEELSEGELRELLTVYHIEDKERALRNIIRIRSSMYEFQTFRGRRLLLEILPAFLSEALTCRFPDAALNNLESFAELLSSEESYLEFFAGNRQLIPVLVDIFSQSEYLARAIIKRPEYLELLSHEMYPKRSLASLKRELNGIVNSGRSFSEAIRIFKQMEEIRLGTFFLDKKIDVRDLTKGLSRTADSIVSVCYDELHREGEISVIGLGKAGGRELTFSSDIDLIFASEDNVTEGDTRVAERLIRLLIAYTQDGMAYKVDVRLRPEGTKGPLVSAVSAYRDYYMTSARFWELQALLKARPMAGNARAGMLFMNMRRDVLITKGREVSSGDVRAMRERIERELSKEAGGYDIKLGPGGIEEVEFLVQYLQLINCHTDHSLLVQGTTDALRRLHNSGIIDEKTACFLRDSYLFYRKVESFMRLTGEPVLREGSSALKSVQAFTGFSSADAFLSDLNAGRVGVRELFGKLLC